MSHHPLYRNQSPQWFRANIFLLGLYTWQSTLQSETCPLRIFKKGNCAAARALYRKKNAAEHFIESISFERGPRGERCLGRAARARQKCLQIEALLARAARPGPHSPWGLLSREILFYVGLATLYPGRCSTQVLLSGCSASHFIVIGLYTTLDFDFIDKTCWLSTL